MIWRLFGEWIITAKVEAKSPSRELLSSKQEVMAA